MYYLYMFCLFHPPPSVTSQAPAAVRTRTAATSVRTSTSAGSTITASTVFTALAPRRNTVNVFNVMSSTTFAMNVRVRNTAIFGAEREYVDHKNITRPFGSLFTSYKEPAANKNARLLRNPGLVCACDAGYIRNHVTGECSTQLCDDVADTFCMNYGECNNEASNCSCHRAYTDHNCETCKSSCVCPTRTCVLLWRDV